MKWIPEISEFSIVDTSAYEINKLMDDIRRGKVDAVKDGGLTSGTIRNHQSTLRRFYGYHDDLGIEKDDIMLFQPNESSVDERDVFTREDVHAIRDAAQHPRDAALIDLLVYTGQRISAILNLRNKDLDPDEGVLYLNTTNGDMKGADGKRPLLLAENAVREWKRKHPCSDDPDAYFITQKNVSQNKPNQIGSKLNDSTVYRVLQTIGKRAGVDKPTNAHNFRHTFVTWAKRDRGMDNDTIKRLIGHNPDSTVMESTYSHLTDDDVIDKAEVAVGIKDKEDDNPFKPEGPCPVCNAVLPENAVACHSCGTSFSHDSQAIQKQMEDDTFEAKGEAQTEADHTAVDAIRDVLQENPELLIHAAEEEGLLPPTNDSDSP